MKWLGIDYDALLALPEEYYDKVLLMMQEEYDATQNI